MNVLFIFQGEGSEIIVGICENIGQLKIEVSEIIGQLKMQVLGNSRNLTAPIPTPRLLSPH
ncbi:MAG: hypothetical protein KAR54_02780, partial [Candidatus Pacebacteria bacterium]|nr:hypothetical protein [Candidatus Paceibacterota bacterium]